MSYSVNDIIKVNVFLSSKGLGTADFSRAVLFVPKTDGNKGSLDENKMYTYGSLQEVADAFDTTTEAYKVCEMWLGGIPMIRKIHVWVRDPLDSTWADTLNKARDKNWWFWTFVTSVAYEQADEVKQIAQWCESQGSMFVNCQTGASATSIRDSSEDSDIASELTKLGYTNTYTSAHLTNAYSGIYLAKQFAIRNYNAPNSTITGEFKKSPGLSAEDLPTSETSAMEKETKKCSFYTVAELAGQVDMGIWKNTKTHSTYGEYIDDVVNRHAFVNFLVTALYNAIATTPTKLPQTSVGQAIILASARRVCEKFIENGYLGRREYVDPSTGETKYTRGYEILTVATDILKLSTEERKQRKAAPVVIRIFPAGAIHGVDCDVYVY